MSELANNLAAIRSRMQAACERSGRSVDDVTLIAVSKGHAASKIRTLADLGQLHFGESYVQEWRDKAEEVGDVHWHFIGHLQSNKAKAVLQHADLVHSVDRPSLMKEIARRAERPVSVLLQINIAEDPAKFGADPSSVLETLAAAAKYENLRVRGLMTIPPFTDDPEDARPHFRALRAARERCAAWLAENAPDRAADFAELSMGMSGDFEVAIEEGATMIRIGTALMGPRS